mmetsp:Transcript_12441/g.20305  ORF Transcript_12441/g.20305 Transcript_12441/m.20305 type:complete len:266 (-) Transcript_12441:913-1710(-)
MQQQRACQPCLLLERIQEAPQGQVPRVDDGLVPLGEPRRAALCLCHVDVVVLVLGLLWLGWLAKEVHVEAQVVAGVLVGAQGLPLQQLQQLDHHQPADSGCGGGDGWDDLTRNHLALVPRGLLDAVVCCTQVGGRRDEIDVEVEVLVLLKVRRLHGQAAHVRRAQLRQQAAQLGWGVLLRRRRRRGRPPLAVLLLLPLVQLDLLAGGHVRRHVRGGQQLLQPLRAAELVVGRQQLGLRRGHQPVGRRQHVGGGQHKVHVLLVLQV